MFDDQANARIEEFRTVAAELAGLPVGADFRASWRKVAASGVLAGGGEPEGTGSRASVTGSVAAVEGLGLGGLDPGLLYGMTSQLFGIQMPLSRMLTEDQRGLLVGTGTGDTLLCHASTEERGGSDLLGATTRADVRPDGSYELTGVKSFVTAAPVADVALVLARTDAGRHPFCLSAFLVDLRQPGVSRGTPVPKTALPGVPMGALRFDRVRVPASGLVLGEGSGLTVMNATTTWERALLLSYALGPMRSLLERTTRWCRERRQFERPMGASHQVAGRVADIALRIHRCRTQLYSLARRLDEGVPIRHLTAEAAMVKISVTEDHVRVVQEAAVLAGVRAYVGGEETCADPASALAGLTYAGPNDLLRVTVARELGLPVGN